MRIERVLVRSKIARRILLFLVLSALVPLAVMAALSLRHVQNLLVAQSHARLARASDAYAAALHDRLQALERRVDEIAARVHDSVPDVDDGSRRRREFVAIAIVDGADRVQPLSGELSMLPDADAAQTEQLSRGHIALAVAPAAKGAARVFLVRALDPARPTDGRLVAEIDPTHLWREGNVLPPMTGVCVIDGKATPLFCSDDTTRAAAGRLAETRRDSGAGRFAFESGGQSGLAAFRALPLEAQFGTRGWTVIASEREAVVVAPGTEFRSVFIPVTALALALAGILALAQARRTLRPVEKVIEGIRRAGDGDFATTVDVVTDDELGELASSFNSMAARLGRQFAALVTLADVDHAILSRLDLDRVIETVVLHMRDIVPADFVSIAVVDRNSPDMLRLYTRDQRGDAGVERARCASSNEATAVLLAHPEGLWLERAEAAAPYLAPIANLGAAALLVLPIIGQGTLVGSVALGFRGPPVLTDVERETAIDLGDRVGVAFATAARDEQLYYQANYDALTALPNRLYFKDQLARRFAQAQREPQPFALLFIDLDDFKSINDSVGHAAGDEVLRQTAERLKACVRETDTVTRLGGDEFTIILSQIRSERDPESVAEHVLASMAAPFVVGGHEHFLNASIGIALHPADGRSPEDLLRNADTAMYRAKEGGRGRYLYFEQQMNVAALARVNLERELRRAIEHGEFSLWYQPQLDVRSGRILRAEALLRWDCPGREQRLPAEFIRLAEETGLVLPIGDWVFREACRQVRAWRDEGLGLSRVAVNISARQFRRKEFVERVAEEMHAAGIGAGCLELEITESLLIDASPGVTGTLDELRSLGISLGLDDFGTGYSSLAYLKRFPVETVKIDREFVTELGGDEGSGGIAAAIIAMAHALHKRVVAEGVETERQAAILGRLGCDDIQGYYVSRPLTARQFAQFVRAAGTSSTAKSSMAARRAARV